MERVVITVDGRVQGVGFRWWAQAQARDLSLAGYAKNLMDGRVEISAQGSEGSMAKLIRRSVEKPSSTGRPGWVDDYTIEWFDEDPSLKGFRTY